jgi:hypothetical protein
MEILDLARTLRLECVSDEQIQDLLSAIDNKKTTKAVAKSLLSTLKTNLLGIEMMGEFSRVQSQIDDLEFLVSHL